MKQYKIIVNEKQLELIRDALESYSRLGIGQLEVVLHDLGFKNFEQFSKKINEFHSIDVEQAISVIKCKIFDMSFHSSHSICSSEIHDNFKVCYDMFTEIKNILIKDNKMISGSEKS